jgi:flagellar hook assembly protein FlgD
VQPDPAAVGAQAQQIGGMGGSIAAEPNPFRPATTLSYELPVPGRVHLAILDSEGRMVRTLVDAWQVSGTHHVPWDGRSDLGRPAGPGMYHLRLVEPHQVRTGKVIRIP